MPTVLVTGGAGYIGSHTTVELLNAEFDVICIDNFSNSSPDVFKSIKQIAGKNVTYYTADVCDSSALSEIFSNHTFDGVIHFAGYKAVGESVDFPLRYYRNNIDSTLSLCETCIKHDVKNIVFSSSATVYGEPQFLPLTENHPLSATNPYGNCKLFIEYILRDLQAAHPSMNIALLRYFNPVGAHESALLCETPKGAPNNLMPYICQTAAGIREKLYVFGNDYETIDGTGVRDYIHVVDLAKGHVAALQKLTENPGCVTYNLGTGNGTSVLKLLSTFIAENNVEVPYSITNRRAGDIPQCWAATDKAEKELGWKAELNLKEMVQSSWKAQCALSGPR
ncbi:UDP-glucose 4-epimerase GalE [Halodesulfovibrio aestuarii]|uniref:UDP-glucose 4-epimerase GalE n=1 Tax=Halodesulfovibrio aestuarii TaxID=126333 RepID=UPI003D34AE73